jgi:hypothetical protein
MKLAIEVIEPAVPSAHLPRRRRRSRRLEPRTRRSYETRWRRDGERRGLGPGEVTTTIIAHGAKVYM